MHASPVDEGVHLSMSHVVGIDAGGTKTVGLLADRDGRVLAEARAGGANLHVHGELGVEKVFHEIIETLAAPGSIDALCLGMAGVDRAEDEGVVRDVLRRLGLRRAVRIVHDAAVALVAGAPERTGIVVVAGTGSIAYGVDPAGHEVRSGGWGYLLADEGSAFWIGHQTMRRCVQAADGRGPATTLSERLAKRLQRDVPDGLIAWVYDQELPKYRIAELAVLVQEAADAGDPVARALLDEAAQHLAEAARAVARRLDFPGPFPLVLAGGAFRACPSLHARLESDLDLPRARLRPLDGEPAQGAVTLALELLG